MIQKAFGYRYAIQSAKSHIEWEGNELGEILALIREDRSLMRCKVKFIDENRFKILEIMSGEDRICKCAGCGKKGWMKDMRWVYKRRGKTSRRIFGPFCSDECEIAYKLANGNA